MLVQSTYSNYCNSNFNSYLHFGFLNSVCPKTTKIFKFSKFDPVWAQVPWSHVQFLEHNIQISVLPNTLSIIFIKLLFYLKEVYSDLYLKKIVKLHFVLAQTLDLYETWTGLSIAWTSTDLIHFWIHLV
jgi:hypothetical protein